MKKGLKQKGLRKQKLTPQEVVSAAKLRRYLGIDPNKCDAIIVCDGSGSVWDATEASRGIGWGAKLMLSNSVESVDFWGSASSGTNNAAEILALLHPLLYLEQLEAGIKEDGCQVHVVTDSQYVAGIVNSNLLKRLHTIEKNLMLWYAVFGATRSGLVLTAHHVGREDLAVQKLAHDLSHFSRVGRWRPSQQPKLAKKLREWDEG